MEFNHRLRLFVTVYRRRDAVSFLLFLQYKRKIRYSITFNYHRHFKQSKIIVNLTVSHFFTFLEHQNLKCSLSEAGSERMHQNQHKMKAMQSKRPTSNNPIPHHAINIPLKLLQITLCCCTSFYKSSC